LSDKKKPLHEFETEELLEYLEQEDAPEDIVEKDHVYLNNVVHFINHYKLQSGEYAVNAVILYKLYTLLVDYPQPVRAFKSMLNRFFHHYSNSNGDFYKLNIDSLHLMKEYDILFIEKKNNNFASPGIRKHFEVFLEKKNVTSGDFWIQGFFIHDIYRDYCREINKKPRLSYQNFQKMLQLYFENRRITSERALWFKVNKETAEKHTEEERKIIINSRKIGAYGRKTPRWITKARRNSQRIKKAKSIKPRTKSKN
jgi:hypothetical protein